jgi:hypothetical protein
MPYLPIKPQWAPAARPKVEEIIKKDMVVHEWGNGCSTPWVASRCKHLFAVDDDINWSNRARRLCAEMGITNVDFSVYPELDVRYMETIFWFSEMGGIDLAIVDGMNRVKCFEYAVKYVKPGGLIILDDSQRDEYKKCFKQGLEMIWNVGDEQTTTLFRKLR